MNKVPTPPSPHCEDSISGKVSPDVKSILVRRGDNLYCPERADSRRVTTTVRYRHVGSSSDSSFSGGVECLRRFYRDTRRLVSKYRRRTPFLLARSTGTVPSVRKGRQGRRSTPEAP